MKDLYLVMYVWPGEDGDEYGTTRWSLDVWFRNPFMAIQRRDMLRSQGFLSEVHEVISTNIVN